MSPTARTLRLLRAEGWAAEVVERWLPGANVRRDLFGCVDVVAVRPGEILGVQCCTAGDVSKRARKARAGPGLRAWLGAGCAFEVWGWAKRGPRGGRKVWQVRKVALTAGGPGAECEKPQL
jgi:hypothetical protein